MLDGLGRWAQQETVRRVVLCTILLDMGMGLPLSIVMASLKTVLYGEDATMMPILPFSLLLDLASLAVLISKTLVLGFLHLDYLGRPGGYAGAAAPQRRQIRRLFKYVAGMNVVVLVAQGCSALSLLWSVSSCFSMQACGVLLALRVLLTLPVYTMLVLVFYVQCQRQQQRATVKPINSCFMSPEVIGFRGGASRYGSDQLCCICLSHPAGGEMVTRLSCGHDFHTNCVVPWFRLHSHCPFRCQ